MNKTLTIVIVVLLLLAAVVYFMTDDNGAMDTMNEEEMAQMNQEQENDAQTSGQTQTQTQTEPEDVMPANSIVLAATETGIKVNVQSATLAVPGYVVVYRVNSQNETQVIGNSSLLEAGDYTDLSIQLDSGIAKEQTIVAVLHADDGDGEFEFPGSDGYLGDMSQSVYTDVDIVDMDASEESVALNENVQEYLMENEMNVEVESN